MNTNGVVVSHLHGWLLVGDYPLAPGDPCTTHCLAEGYL